MNEAVVRKALRMDMLSQPVLGYAQIVLVIIGGLFWAMASQRAEAFDVRLYGTFALSFKAETWAVAMMAPAALVWIGLRNPIKRWMVMVGTSLQICQFCALGYSALFTGGEPIIGIFCVVCFAPMHAYILGAALNEP